MLILLMLWFIKAVGAVSLTVTRFTETKLVAHDECSVVSYATRLI